MKGRGREAPHQDQRGSMLDSVLPVIQCDFGYLTDVGEEPVVALFASCRSSTNLLATRCTTKGPIDTYVVAAFASWIWELGHARLIIQSDGQTAIPALVSAVRDTVIADGEAEQITCQVSPKGSHESNGAAERTVQQVRGMARVYLEHVREKTASEFPPKSQFHAAWIYNRFHVRADTRVTPYSKIRLKTYAQPVLPFGELGRPPKAAAGEVSELIWVAPLPAMPNAYREPTLRSEDSKARSETLLDATSTSDKPDVQERPPPEPDGKRATKQPRRDAEDTLMPGPVGASSSSTVAAILDTTRPM